MNVLDYLQQAVHLSPHKAAFIERGSSCTFSQLQADGLRIGTYLQDKGVKKGDAVLLLQPLSTDLYKALIGIWSIGAVALVFDPSAGREHIRACCAIIRPVAFIGSGKAMLLTLYSRAIAAIPIKLTTGTVPFVRSFRKVLRQVATDATPHASPHEAPQTSGESPALITFTSGSTGVPKAAVRTHAFLATQYEVLSHSLSQQESHVDFATLPIVALANLAARITTVIADTSLTKMSRMDAAAVAKQMVDHRVSRLVASPTFMKRLAVYCNQKQMTLPSLTHIYTGGGPVFPHIMEQMKQAMPNSKRFAVYGSTEAEPIAELDWDDVSPDDIEKMKIGGGLLSGHPVQQIDCKIISATFADQYLPHGKIGEIVVHGAHVLKGYLNGVGDAENKFEVDGARWHRTGDTGYFDESGRLWLTGRASAVIRDSKGVIYPFCVEAAVHAQFAVERVAFVSFLGKRTLVLERGAYHHEPAIRQQLQWALIDQVLFVTEIPTDKRHNAKIDYRGLEKLLVSSQ